MPRSRRRRGSPRWRPRYRRDVRRGIGMIGVERAVAAPRRREFLPRDRLGDEASMAIASHELAKRREVARRAVRSESHDLVLVGPGAVAEMAAQLLVYEAQRV